MPWGNKFPDMKNDPTYLEPRVTAAEANINSNTTQLAEKATQTDVGTVTNLQTVAKTVVGAINENVTSIGQKAPKAKTDSWVDVKVDFGAKGDGVSDDTTAIQNAINSLPNGGEIRIPPGTYLTRKLTVGMGIKIIGSGLRSSTIKLLAGSNSTLIDMKDPTSSVLRDLTLDGNKSQNTYNDGVDDPYTSVVKVYSSSGQANTWYIDINAILIQNGANNGLSLVAGAGYGSNWVYHLNNITIKSCYGYGFYDGSNDNTFSNFDLNGNRKAGLYCTGGSKMYVNFKVDWNGGNTPNTSWGTANVATDTIKTDIALGANVIIRWASNIRFVNLDVQSASQVGVKILSSDKVSIDGDINNSGTLYTLTNDLTYYGLGLFIQTSSNIKYNGVFYNVDVTNPQKTDVEISTDCYYCTILDQTLDTNVIKNNGHNCKVTNQIDQTVTTLRDNTKLQKSITNTIANGDFSGGTTSWSAVGGSFTVSSGEATITPTVTNCFIGQSITVVKGHVYYVEALVKASTAKTSLVVLKGSSPYTVLLRNEVYHSGSGNYETLANLFSVTQDDVSGYLFRVHNTDSSNWTPFYVKHGIFMDLTSIYGAGKEPSDMSQIQQMISQLTNGYVNGTVIPPQICITDSGYYEGMINQLVTKTGL